jgi:hypothetical protein
MSDEMIVLALQSTGTIPVLACVPVSAVAGKAPELPGGCRGNCTPQTIRIRGCRQGGFS